MQVGAILRRWIEVLAVLLSAVQETWSTRRCLVVRRDAAGFLIDDDRSRYTAAVGEPVAAHIAKAARNATVVLALSPESVAARRITVPAKAQEFLSGIIRNQIDRLSPWQADEAAYGFSVSASRKDAATLDVRVMITSRTIIEAARAEIAAIGLSADRIVVSDDTSTAPIALWSRFADSARVGTELTRRAIGIAVAGGVALSLAVTLWALLSAAAIRDASEDLAARTKTVERQLHGARNSAAIAAADPPEAAWIAKQTVPSAVVLIDALSQALPDTAHLTELQFDRSTLRMTGLAADAPSLVAPLERSGHFTGVHFFAPTTRGTDAAVYRFHIEAQVEPRFDLNRD